MDPYLAPYTNIIPKCIIDPKLLENVGEKSLQPGVRQRFLSYDTKVWSKKQKLTNLTSSKSKASVFYKNTVMRMKDKAQTETKYLQIIYLIKDSNPDHTERTLKT